MVQGGRRPPARHGRAGLQGAAAFGPAPGALPLLQLLALRLLALAAVLLLPATAVAAGPSPVLKGPWLTELGAHGVSIRAEVDPPAPVSVVIDSATPPRELRDDQTRAIHVVRVDGLEPHTRYRYSLHVGGAQIAGSFTTAPPDDDPAPIRFIIYGDDRSDVLAHASVVRAISDEPSDFLINTGDMVGDGASGSQWQTFFEVEGPLLRDRCLFPAIGNHELEDGTMFPSFFGPSYAEGFDYTFRWGRARFFFVNGEGSFTGKQRDWLDRVLTKADAEPGLVWRVFVIHDGPYASGIHGDNPAVHAGDIPEMLARHHVDFVLEGHDHLYERGAADGLRYVASGGGGAPLYPVVHRRATTRKVESTHHFVLFELGKDSGTLTAKRVDGSVIEQVGFKKTNLWDDDPAPPAPPPSGPAVGRAPPAPPQPLGWTASQTTHTLRNVVIVLGALAAVAWGVRRMRRES